MWADPATSAHPIEPVTTIAGHPDWPTQNAADGFHPGDTFCIDVRMAPDLGGELTISPNGRVTPPQLSAVMAAMAMMAVNRSAPELQVTLEQTDARELIDPSPGVTPTGLDSQSVFVGDEGESPGPFDMPGETRALQAVRLSGNATDGGWAQSGWAKGGRHWPVARVRCGRCTP